MDFAIRGKNAIVIGAGSGLGAASAKALAAEGVHTVLVGRRAEMLAKTQAEIESSGGTTSVCTWDIANPSIASDRVAEIRSRVGPISILINNTGGPAPGPASGLAPEVWATSFQSMVTSVIAITDAVLPDMQAQTWGRIITIASSGVIAPIPNLVLSNALRSTLVGWSKTLSKELAKQGITVNMALPGRIATDRVQFLDESRANRESKPVSQVIQESMATIPVGRYGRPEEFGCTVAFLASAQAAYITGSMIRIDGGLIASV